MWRACKVKYGSNKYELDVICPLKVIWQYRIQHLILVLILLPDKPVCCEHSHMAYSEFFFFGFLCMKIKYKNNKLKKTPFN